MSLIRLCVYILRYFSVTRWYPTTDLYRSVAEARGLLSRLGRCQSSLRCHHQCRCRQQRLCRLPLLVPRPPVSPLVETGVIEDQVKILPGSNFNLTKIETLYSAIIIYHFFFRCLVSLRKWKTHTRNGTFRFLGEKELKKCYLSVIELDERRRRLEQKFLPLSSRLKWLLPEKGHEQHVFPLTSQSYHSLKKTTKTIQMHFVSWLVHVLIKSIIFTGF